MKSVFFIFYCFLLCQGETGDCQENMNSIYNNVLREINSVETSKYYITIKISKNYPISEDLYKSLRESTVLTPTEVNDLEKEEISFSEEKDLTCDILKVIDLSKQNSIDKMELEYIFSWPYKVSNEVILLFNTIHYKTSNGVIKGGGKRIFLFQKRNSSWELQRKIPVLDF